MLTCSYTERPEIDLSEHAGFAAGASGNVPGEVITAIANVRTCSYTYTQTTDHSATRDRNLWNPPPLWNSQF